MMEFLKKVWQGIKDAAPANYKQWTAATISLVLAVLTSLVIKPTPEPVLPPTPPLVVNEPEPPPPWQSNFGWVNDPGAVQAIANNLKFKVFSDTPAGAIKDDTLPKFCYLWQSYVKISGRGPPAKDQGQVGSCVSFGTNNAVLRSLATDLALARSRGEFKDIAEEVTYGGSRVQIGGGRLRGGDGSVGAWAAEFVKQYGVVPRETVAGVDLSAYVQSRCKTYGDSGPPKEILEVAKKSPVKEITLVRSWAEAKKALAQGYGIAVCSNQGFSMSRDSRGVAKPQGSWAHCMCLDGYHIDSDGKEYGHIANSWGANAHKGPVGWGDPGPEGFWTDSSTINRMLGQGDSWAFSGVVGFPAREIDWFVIHQEHGPHFALTLSRRNGDATVLLTPTGRRSGANVWHRSAN